MMKNNSIQIFRFVLFFLVLCFHCGVPFFNIGWIAVESFFVVSAFFLTKKYYKNDFIYLNEAKKRVIRLSPPYLVVLIIGLIYATYVKRIPFDFFSHIFFVQNIHWMFTGYVSPMQPITAHTWTLSIELICDLLLLCILKCFKKNKWPFYIMLCIGISWRIITIGFGLNNYVVSLCPLAHFDSFALGALLAIKTNEDVNKTWFNISALLIGTLGILSCIFITSLVTKQSIVDSYNSYSFSSNYLNNVYTGNIYLFISLLSIGVMGLLYKTINGKRNFIKQLLVKFGDNSYYMYLFHWPFLFLLTKILKDWYVTLPIVFVVSIFSSLVFSKIVYMIKKKSAQKSTQVG